MIVICPNCNKKYKLADDVVAGGVHVRCKACEFVWFFSDETKPSVEVCEKSDNSKLSKKRCVCSKMVKYFAVLVLLAIIGFICRLNNLF